jgi:hypothetical protein
MTTYDQRFGGLATKKLKKRKILQEKFGDNEKMRTFASALEKNA